MKKNKSNYFRVMLQTGWKYPQRILDDMDNQECENEYDYVTSKMVSK